MPFIGNQPANAFTSFAKQDFTTSATTSYTLDNPVANANELALFINFVRQEPTTAYSASGTTLTLTSATSATDDMYCVFLGKALQTVNPADGSVGTSQLSDGAVTSAKLASGTGGKVLQVVSTTKTDTFTTSSSSFVDITGLSVSITPTSSSSKILVYGVTNVGNETATAIAFVNLVRDSTSIFLGDTAGSRTRASGHSRNADRGEMQNISVVTLDSPNTTSATTYKIQMSSQSSFTAVLNRTGFDGDEAPQARTASSITVMEIAG